MKMRFCCLLCMMLLGAGSVGLAQDNLRTDNIFTFPGKIFSKIDEKATQFEKNIIKGTEKYLTKLQKQEQKLYKKLYKKDSAAARQLFGDVNAKYVGLRNELNKPPEPFNSLSNCYNGHLDSLNTTIRFLQENQKLDSSGQPAAQSSLARFKSLQGKLNASEQIRKTLQQRRKMLQEQLQKFGLTRQFQQFKKQVYYYQQQIAEYKSIFENSAKLEQQLMQWATKLPAFQQFFANFSQLGNLFALPGSGNTTATLSGLQTRASVQQDIANRFGSGTGIQQMLQQNMGEAQGMINDLKNRINSLGTQSSDEELPDFKMNTQKTKSLLERIELGTNFQSMRSTNYFPNTSDIGLSVGYRLNDKSVIGVGGSYKLGLGRGWNNMRLTSEGISLRSFVDIRLKGSFWLSGGYEQNYRTAFSSIDQLREKNGWQQSGLIGVSKVISLKTKFFKKTSIKLLWDFMSYQQVPQTQAIIFRVGYSFK